MEFYHMWAFINIPHVIIISTRAGIFPFPHFDESLNFILLIPIRYSFKFRQNPPLIVQGAIDKIDDGTTFGISGLIERDTGLKSDHFKQIVGEMKYAISSFMRRKMSCGTSQNLTDGIHNYF